MMNLVVEAALRSLLMAATVWAGLRLLRISNVVVQKIAWGLVLIAAFTMPFLMRWHFVQSWPAFVVPIYRPAQEAAAGAQITAPAAPLPPQRSAYAPPASHLPPATHAQTVIQPRPATEIAETDVPSAFAMQPLRRHAVRAGSWGVVPPATMLVILYLGIGGFLLLRLLLGLSAAFRLWRRAESASSGLVLRDSVRISSAINTPVTIGSSIMLPACYGEWDERKLRIVLAHERAHVRQGDFYLQLLASLYAAAFWFSPLGWLLLRKLSDLGEAISDRAALKEAATPSGYAELLLEFAAIPRRSLAGVAMARSSNIQQRIERLLNERHFRLAFLRGKRHGLLAAALLPCALVAATSLVRVQAAEVQAGATAHVDTQAEAPPAAVVKVAPVVTVTPLVKVKSATAVRPAVAAAPVVAVTPIVRATPTVAVAPSVIAQPAVTVVRVIPDKPVGMVIGAMPVTPMLTVLALPVSAGEPQAVPSAAAGAGETAPAPAAPAVQPPSPAHPHARTSGRGPYVIQSGDGEQDSYTVVSDGSSSIHGAGDFGGDFGKARSKVHGDFIWFKHGGKSYVIDDPALVAQARQLSKPMEELGRKQAELGEKQAQLGAEQARLGELQAHASIPTPDMSKAWAETEAALKQLQLDKKPLMSQQDLRTLEESVRKMQAQPSISMPDLSHAMAEAQAAMKRWDLENRQWLSDANMAAIQERMAELQGRFGQWESKIGEKQSAIGEQQSAMGEQQSKLGEQQSELGKQQSKLAEENSHKMKSMFDDALRSGKAKPIE